MKYNILFFITLAVLVGVIAVSGIYLYSAKQHKSATPDLTEEERIWLQQHKESISILADPAYPPIDFMHQDGVHDGLAEDFFRLIEMKLNIHFLRARATSWSNLLEMAKMRQADVIKCGAQTPERSHYMLFSQPYIEVETMIIVRSDNKKSLTINDLAGRKVALTKDYSVHEYIRNNFPSIALVPVDNDSLALKMASSGEVDAAISDLPTASYFISNLGITNLRIAGGTDHYYRLSVATRNDWPLLNSSIKKAIDSITEAERSAIFDKWIKLEYSKVFYSAKFWNILIITIGAVIALLLFIFLWNRTLHAVVAERTKELKNYKDHLEKMVEERTAELTETNRQLQIAVDKVQTLSGIIPICASCKKIRDDNGYWEQVDKYIATHASVEVSHSLCPDCVRKLYPDYADKILHNEQEK